MSNPQAFAILAALAAMLVVVTMVSAGGMMREWRKRRSVSEALRELETMRTESEHQTLLRMAQAERPLRRFFNDLPGFQGVEDKIAQAGLYWRIERFVLYTALLALFLGGLLWVTTQSPFLAVFGMAVGAWFPRFQVTRKAVKRTAALEGQLPGAIDHLTRAVRAGHPLSAGLKMLAEESPEPVAGEFRAVFEEQRFGLPFEDALLGLGDRINLPDVRILITAILVQREVGGNLAETLENVGSTMRARSTIRRQVKVYTVQGRMSGYILAALPIFVGLFIFLVNRDYINILFTHPVGKGLLGLAMVLQLVGFLWIRKIVAVEY